MREYGHTFTIKQLLNRMERISKMWDKELRRLLAEDAFVGYKNAEECVLSSFRTAGLI